MSKQKYTNEYIKQWLEKRTSHWLRKENDNGFTLGGVFGTGSLYGWDVSVIVGDKYHLLKIKKENPHKDFQIIKSKINNLLKDYKPWRPWWKDVKGIPEILTADLSFDDVLSFSSNKKMFVVPEGLKRGKFVYKPNQGMSVVIKGEEEQKITKNSYWLTWCDETEIKKINFIDLKKSDDDVPF